MAKITSGVGFSSAAGSVAGLTYRAGREGLTLRAKAIQRGGRNALQSTSQAQLTSLAQSWKQLTADQRARWQTRAVAGTQHPRIGQSAPRDGFHLYVAINCLLLESTQAIVTTPPALTSLDRATVAVSAASIGGSTLMITPTWSSVPSFRTVLYCTRPKSPGRSLHTQASYRAIGNRNRATANNEFSRYSTAFGTPQTAQIGQVFQVRAVCISITGWVSASEPILVTWTA